MRFFLVGWLFFMCACFCFVGWLVFSVCMCDFCVESWLFWGFSCLFWVMSYIFLYIQAYFIFFNNCYREEQYVSIFFTFKIVTFTTPEILLVC